jgi:hydantoinase/carbamoylase family amidase
MILERGVKLSKPVEVVSFIEEEGARFMGGLLGSSLATGKYANADAIMGRDGTAFNDALAGVEFPYPVNAASNLRERVDSYLELHIEQGRRLESAGIPIGVVTAIAGPNFMRVEFKGRSDHAGATAYEDRHDTLLAAAETITRIREMGVTKFAGKGHMTVGKINAVKPNVTNVVAGETIFEVDFRADTVETAEAMKAALSALFDEVCAKHRISYMIPELHSVPAAPAPERLREAVSNGARQAGVESKDLVSWAAHDAMVMATVTDSGMIFVPCREGRSHTPEEYTKPEDIAAGIATMANALVELAQ